LKIEKTSREECGMSLFLSLIKKFIYFVNTLM